MTRAVRDIPPRHSRSAVRRASRGLAMTPRRGCVKETPSTSRPPSGRRRSAIGAGGSLAETRMS
eukprot:7588513-Heterocapsa_arctica.AAC.1